MVPVGVVSSEHGLVSSGHYKEIGSTLIVFSKVGPPRLPQITSPSPVEVIVMARKPGSSFKHVLFELFGVKAS